MVIGRERQLRKLTLIVLIRQALLNLFGEVQAMIRNDHSKAITYIARDVEVSEFLIRKVMYEYFQYSSYRVRRGQFLYKTVKSKRKERATRL